MLNLMWTYLSRVAGRSLRRLVSLELVVAAVAATLYGAHGLPSGGYAPPLAEAARQLSGYAALGFGTCLTTMGLAARWATEDFSEFLRAQRGQPSRVANYNILLFKLSWTAIVHWVLLIAGILVGVVASPDWKLWGSDPGSPARVSGAVLVFLFAYGLMLLLSSVLVLSILCVARAEHIANRSSG